MKQNSLVCLVGAPGQDKDFVVWAVCKGSSHTRQTVSVSVVSVKPRRHNQWWFCHMLNAA